MSIVDTKAFMLPTARHSISQSRHRRCSHESQEARFGTELASIPRAAERRALKMNPGRPDKKRIRWIFKNPASPE